MDIQKEAHLFLNAPRTNTILENIWWSRCTARGFSNNMLSWLVKHGLTNKSWRDNWFISILDFYARWLPELNALTLQDTFDYLSRVRALDNNFSLKGRTLASVINLSNEWHRAQQKVKHGGYFAWPGIPITDWGWEDKQTNNTWEIVQLLDSTTLYKEGRKMKHCVYSYAASCAKGDTHIFTLKDKFGDSRLTIQIRAGEVIQARGSLNRVPTNYEKNILAKWVIHNGLSLGWKI